MKRLSPSLSSTLASVASRRSAHAKPTASHAHQVPPGEFLVQQLSNGLQVACSVTPNSVGPLQFSATFRAGARHENHANEEAGICHFLRRSLGLRSEAATGFGTVRSLQQMGASVECASSRELLTMNLRLAKATHLHEAATLLGSAATACLFAPWEVPKVVYPHISKDLDFLHRSNFSQLLIELLHRAAYRAHPLGHSLYAPRYAVQRGFSENVLTGFQARCMTPSRATLVATAGQNMFADVEALMKSVLAVANSSAFRAQTPGQTAPLVTDGKTEAAVKSAVVSGGDARYSLPPLELAMVAVAWEGLPVGHKDASALAVLMSALDGGQGHKSPASAGILSKALGPQNSLVRGFSVGALSWSYADSGLVGFELQGNGKDVANALPKVLQNVRRVARDGITAEELKRAKVALNLEILLALESPNNTARHVVEELALTGKCTSFQSVLASLEAVTLDDVKRVAGAVFKEKVVPSLAAVGDIEGIPYLSDSKI